MRKINPRDVRGVTLVEMMIVVLIIAVIAALAVPMASRDAPAKLRAAALMLQADLDFARMASITHGDDPRVVVFDPDEQRYHVATMSDPDTPVTNPADRLPYRVTFGQGRARNVQNVTIAGTSFGQLNQQGDEVHQIGFGIYGQLTQNDDATITLACQDHTITLTIHAASGEVSIGQLE